jgi:hypothetical protein
MVAWEIVTLEPPELVNVPDTNQSFPTCTSPKLRLDGLAVSDPGATPAPDKLAIVLSFEVLDTTAISPFAFPAICGVKATVNVVL